MDFRCGAIQNKPYSFFKTPEFLGMLNYYNIYLNKSTTNLTFFEC